MAGVKLNRILAHAALALSVCALLCGQSPGRTDATGTLSGRLTDLHSAPLAGVAVVVRNQATGAESRVTTGRNGSFRSEQLEPGSYSVTAEGEELGRGQLTGILVQAGHEARVQTAMAFAPLPPRPLVIAHHEIPTETEVPGFRYPLAQLAAWPGPAVWMPAFVHDPPPMESLPIHAELRSRLRPLTNLQQLLTVAAELPPTTGPTQAAAGRAAATDRSAAIQEPVKAASAPTPAPDKVRPALPQAAATAPQAAAGPAEPAGTAAAPQQSAAAVQEAAAVRQETASARLEAPATTTAITSTQLTASELQQLPVSGRRWEEFAELAPATLPAAGSGRAQVRGQGQAETGTTVDGMSTRLAFGEPSGAGQANSSQADSTAEGSGSAHAGGRGMAVSEAAIRSFEAAAALADPEVAHGAGGDLQVTTLRGSRGLHGQAFVYERQRAFGARNPNTLWTRETAPGTATTLPTFTSEPYSPPDHEIIVGLGMGRQLRKNRAFWFAALDYLHRDHPGVAVLKHPDLFFAQPSNDRLQLLGAQIGSGSQAIPRYTQMLETLAGLLGPAPRTTTQWTGFGRVDWNLGERHRVTLEGNANHWDSPGGGFRRTNEAYGSHSFGSSQSGEQWVGGRLESFLTPDLLAVTQLHWSRTILTAHAQEPSAYEKTLNINTWGQLPQITVDSRYGFTIGNPARFGAGSYPNERSIRIHEALNWAHNNLLVKAGLQFDHYADSTTLVRNQTGTYHYSTVENFATDAMAFADLGIAGSQNWLNQHNCDQTGRAWRDSGGGLRGLGYLPCYSYYTQTMGPSGWSASTNEAALYVTAQWQPVKFVTLSAGMRWEHEQLPQPIAAVNNPALPLTQHTPSLGNSWGPRVSLAIGPEDKRWPVLRIGYGIYSSRVLNSTLLTVLSHTGSFNGNLNFYLRPTDNLKAGGAPPFPYVFTGEPLSVVKPGAVEFAPNFRAPQVHQAVLGVEQKLPLHIRLTASAMVSLARYLPVTVDTNVDPSSNPGTVTYNVVDASGKGPIKAGRITVPFYASWPLASNPTGRLNNNYQQVVEMLSRSNSTYEAANIRLARTGSHGVSFRLNYTYAHAMDWNPNESLRLTGGSVLDPNDFSLEYGTSNLDVRHTASLSAVLTTPWKLKGTAGRIANQWSLAGTGYFRSGMPFSMRTGGTLSKAFVTNTGAPIVALGTGMNGSGGDNRIYGLGSDGINYNVGRNTYRYPATWKADLRLTKRLNFSARRQLELMVESFNLFNHRNVTALETVGYTIESGTLNGGLPSLNFMTGLKANSVAFGQPFNVNSTNFYQPRQIEFGARMRF